MNLKTEISIDFQDEAGKNIEFLNIPISHFRDKAPGTITKNTDEGYTQLTYRPDINQATLQCNLHGQYFGGNSPLKIHKTLLRQVGLALLELDADIRAHDFLDFQEQNS